MFENLRVLEFASVLAGPAVGQFFAELGASVVKIENPITAGDVTRTWKTQGESTDDRSAYFCSVNWGKRSIGINMEMKEGISIVHRLVQQSDIVIASYKPGDAIRLGVDYPTLSALRPKLIYGQVTGYGSDDPRVGYDAVIQAEAGFMFMNGEPGGNSIKMPVALIDILAGHQLKEGILLAMLQQAKTGEGGFVEVSLMQAAISSLANQATNWLVGGKIPQKQGSSHPNIAPYGDVFRTLEGQEVLLAIGSDKQFRELCNILDFSYLGGDVRFATNVSRVGNRAVLHQLLQEKFSEFDSHTILTRLSRANIPAGIIRNLAQVFETRQAQEILVKSGDRTGVKTYVGAPRLKNSSHFLPPPHFGEHTVEILSDSLHILPHEIKNLISTGSVH